VASAQKKIFGEGKQLTEEQKKAQGLVFEISANDKAVTKEIGEGEFGKHIGYAPEFTDEPDFDRSRDRNIEVKGSSEIGRLMGDFVWNEMKESRGWAEMALPRWDKPLWDDTGSWFKAPNLRTIGSIASGIAATVLTGGIGGIAGVAAAAAVSTASTAVFDTLDVAYGYKSWEEAGLDIGKSFLTSAARCCSCRCLDRLRDDAQVGAIRFENAFRGGTERAACRGAKLHDECGHERNQLDQPPWGLVQYLQGRDPTSTPSSRGPTSSRSRAPTRRLPLSLDRQKFPPRPLAYSYPKVGPVASKLSDSASRETHRPRVELVVRSIQNLRQAGFRERPCDSPDRLNRFITKPLCTSCFGSKTGTGRIAVKRKRCSVPGACDSRRGSLVAEIGKLVDVLHQAQQ
jgi:hypothetical protein